MDRELSAATQRSARVKNIGRIAIVVVVLTGGFFGFRMFLKPAVSKATIRTALTGIGPLEASLTATGVTVPETEEIITSPISARIQQVLLRAGEKVSPGQSILQLDKAATLSGFQKLQDQQQLKHNKGSQLRISLQRDLNDLETQYRIKQMRVKSLASILVDEEYLLKIGGGTPENTRQAELNLKVARLEEKLLADQIRNKKLAMQADLKDLGFELDMQDRDIRDLARTISQAQVKAGGPGVVTWVKDEIGAAVSQGDVLARVADLRSFKIKATITDAYAGQLHPGGLVSVRVNETDLRGTISSVEPTVTNGVVTFYVQLEKRDHPLLRPNMRVEVYVVTAYKPRVVRVKNGPFYSGAVQQAVFVVQGDKAVRRLVDIGESNFDFVELKNKVAAGEEVIISDMKAYEHVTEIRLKD